MADLCDDGYLSQPHTSAGRVPTEKAFRSYVQSLAPRPPFAGRTAAPARRTGPDGNHGSTRRVLLAHADGDDAQRRHHRRHPGLQPDSRSDRTDRPGRSARADDRRHARSHGAQPRGDLDELVSQDELASIRNYINRNFTGWTLSDIHADLERRLEQQSAAYDALLKKLTLLYSKGLLDIEFAPEIHMEGASNLVGLDLHLTREKLRDLFHTLEEKKRILQLLDRFLEQPAGELAVQVGLADAHPSLRELSLIGISIPLAGGLSAKIAVLGPMRMNYGKAISAVYHVGQAFRSLM